MIEDNSYSQMQRDYYTKEAIKWSMGYKDPVVGEWDNQNWWPGYEWLWQGLFTKGKIALDFATGPGRNIIKYKDRFSRIDGVDFSALIEKCKLHLTTCNIELPKLYVTNGYNLQEPDYVPSNTYDFVFSTIAFQHIAVYDIRFNYLKEFFRVLKSGGWISIQMGYGKFPSGVQTIPTVHYYDNVYDALGTNGHLDTRCESTDYLEKDLASIGYINFSYTITDQGWPGTASVHPNWIFFKAQKPNED